MSELSKSQTKQLLFLSLVYTDAICKNVDYKGVKQSSLHLDEDLPLKPDEVVDCLRALPAGRYRWVYIDKGHDTETSSILHNSVPKNPCRGDEIILSSDTDLLRLLVEDIREIDADAKFPRGIESYRDLFVRMKADNPDTIVADVENWRIDRRDEPVGASSRTNAQGSGDAPLPDDVCSLAVALTEYAVSGVTIRRHVKAGTLPDYRLKPTRKNTPLVLSRHDLGNRWRRRSIPPQ